MAEKGKSDVTPQKRSLKLSPALGDWTTYKPPRQLIKKVKIGLYGFDRLSEEELNQAHLLHYRFAENLLSTLKINLNLGSQLYSVEALQNNYANFLRSVMGPLLQGKILLPELHEEVFISVDLQLVEILIAAALGFQGVAETKKELTEADYLVFETTLNEYLHTYATVFAPILKNIKYKIVTSPDPIQNPSINPQSTFVYFIIEVSLNGIQGRIILGYPGSLIKSLLKSLKDQQTPKPLSFKKLNPEMLSKILLPLVAVLGKTELKASEIQKLEVGDVVSLDNSIRSAITLCLSDKVIILGQPGVSNGHFVARVVGIEKEAKVKVAPPIYVEEKKKEAEVPQPKVPPPLKPGFGFPKRPAIPPKPAPLVEEEFEEEEFPEEEFEELEEEEFPEEEGK